MRIVDITAISSMVRDLRGKVDNKITPADEALMFSIYYATITSMEEDEVNLSVSEKALSHSLCSQQYLTSRS